jgi:drug/metabolite transporter (DMT)-like permease
VFGKQVTKSSPAVIGAQVFTVATLCTLLCFLWSQPRLPIEPVGYAWVTLCCISLILGSFGMFYGIAQLGSFQWSLMLKLEPAFTALFAYLILGEKLQLSQYFGMVLVLGSLIGYQLVQSDRQFSAHTKK